MRTSKIIAGSSAIIVISSFLSFKLYKNERKEEILKVDLSAIPKTKFGDEVRYGRELMLHTAYFIGPDGLKENILETK
jgi:cytochrome c